jgi:hypothetical protein
MAVSFAGQERFRPGLKIKKAAGGVSACGFGLIYGSKIMTAQADASNNTRNKNMLCLGGRNSCQHLR